MGRISRRTLAAFAVVAVTVPLLLLSRATSPPQPAPPAAPGDAVFGTGLVMENLSIRSGDTLDVLLGRAGVEQSAKASVISALDGTFDARKFRAGTQLTLLRAGSGLLHAIEYAIDPDHMLQLLHLNGSYEAAVVEIPGTVSTVPVCSELKSSLFESIARVGESPDLAVRMAEIFAWDLDFYRDPREGDRFCLLVEKKEYANGRPATYQRIFAASYDNAGKVYEGYLFADGGGKPSYYAPDGRSLQSAFLRSPLKFDARISSRFSTRRLHPVLRTYRPHYGTDYAAPTGTPVYSVASGRVTFSAYSGGNGNLITIRHANGYETQYLHLSRRLVRAGQQVRQGDRIGLVGATGVATGPHLDFRVRRNGQYLNFERLRTPPASTVSARSMGAFEAERDRLRTLLEGAPTSGEAVLAGTGSPQARPSP